MNLYLYQEVSKIQAYDVHGGTCSCIYAEFSVFLLLSYFTSPFLIYPEINSQISYLYTKYCPSIYTWDNVT